MQIGKVSIDHRPLRHSAYFCPYKLKLLLQSKRIILPLLRGIGLPLINLGIAHCRDTLGLARSRAEKIF